MFGRIIRHGVLVESSKHVIFFSFSSNNVLPFDVQGNEVYGGSTVGIFLHRSSDDTVVKGKILICLSELDL